MDQRYSNQAHQLYAVWQEVEPSSNEIINIRTTTELPPKALTKPQSQLDSGIRSSSTNKERPLKQKNILGKAQIDLEPTPPDSSGLKDQVTFKATKKSNKSTRQVKNSINQRIGKVQSREQLRVTQADQKPIFEGQNFSAALVHLLQGDHQNADKFSVTFSGQQFGQTESGTGVTGQKQMKTIPADQLVFNVRKSTIDEGVLSKPQARKKSSQYELGQSARGPFVEASHDETLMQNHYSTQPTQQLHPTQIKKSSVSAIRNGNVLEGRSFNRQLDRVTYGRKSSSNRRGAINEALYKNSLVPTFERSSLLQATYGNEIQGRIIISRERSHQNSTKSLTVEDRLDNVYLGQSFRHPSRQNHPQQNIQFNNYSTRGPTEAYTQTHQSVLTPQAGKSPKTTLTIETQRAQKKPPTQRTKKVGQTLAIIESDQRSQFNQLYDVKNQKTITGDGEPTQAEIQDSTQVPRRLESLIKQLILKKQLSTSPNVVIRRPNETSEVEHSLGLEDEANQSLQPQTNVRYTQQDMLSTFTAMSQDTREKQLVIGTTKNRQHDKNERVHVLQHKHSAGDLLKKNQKTSQPSERCMQNSPPHNIKVTSGELGIDKSASKELEIESLLNYQELLNSKDILGSSLPISQTLHIALSNAMKETNSGLSNKLRNISHIDQSSFQDNQSPQKHSAVDKYDLKLMANIAKQQNFISLDLQPKSVGSEDIYEQTLKAFQNDINQLHEIEQSRQEISTRIKEHQRVLNRLHNVHSSNRGSFILPQATRQLQSHGINQKASVEIPDTNMSQIDFAHLQRVQQNSVQPNFYEQRSQFIPSHLQQHYANANETQFSSLEPNKASYVQRGSIGDQASQKITTSPKIGRYRLKGLQGPTYQPISNVYSNRIPNLTNDTKRTKSVRQRVSRHLQPLASTSIGGSNLRSGGRKFVLTQQNSGTKGYGTIDPHQATKKIQTGYIPLSTGLATIDTTVRQIQYVQGLKNKSTTMVYGPQAQSTIGSNSNRRSSVPKARQQLSNLRPTLQTKDPKATRSFSNRNRVIQQSLLNNNNSLRVARNTYASIGSGSLTSQTGYHYGLQNSSIENTKKSSTNALDALFEQRQEDRSISPHTIKSKTQAKPSQREQNPIRKGYKQSTSRGRGEVVASSSIVQGIRKHSQIKAIPVQGMLKAAQMSHQHVVIRDSLQNDTHDQSIVRVTANKPSCSMRMSPDEKQFSIDQSAYESQISPEKLKIIQLQQKLQLSESNGVRQVRIRGMQTRNHFSNDTGGYSNEPVYQQHDLNGQDFRVGGQVISGAANNTKDTHNLRYSRATYDFSSNIYEDDQMPQFDEPTGQEEDQVLSEPRSPLQQSSKLQMDGEKSRCEVILKLINEDNPFEGPQTQAPENQVRSIASKTTGESFAIQTVYGRQRGRFNGQSGGRLSLLAAGAVRRSETTEDSQQCKYLDGTMMMSSLPMPMQSINQIIAEEEAAAEQDEKTTQKESSKHQQKDSSSTPHQSEPTLKSVKSKQHSVTDSVEDECLIGDSQSSCKPNLNEVKEDTRHSGWQSVAQDIKIRHSISQALESKTKLGQDAEQDVSKPVRMFNRVISRGSIKFVGRSTYQSQTSLKPAPVKETDLTSSNLFGVNLLEQQKLQIKLDNKSEVMSECNVSGSDGNILCESVKNDPQTDSSLAHPVVTQSPLNRKSTVHPNVDDQLQLPDFPPLLTTQTNMASTNRSKHSDDQVELRRALEESQTSQAPTLTVEPKLQRQSTHSLLRKLEKHSDDESGRGDIDRVECETPADLNVILGQFYRLPNRDTMAVFNDDVVQLDQDDAQPEDIDGYQRRPPKNNNFFGRPMTAKEGRGVKAQSNF